MSSLLLEWKQEPVSPSSADEVSWVSDDAALYWTSLGDNDGKPELASAVESKAEVAAKLLEDLEHLEDLDQWIKEEEPFSTNWLEEKMLPIFEMGIPQPAAVKVEDTKPVAVPDTQSLLKEFENVYDVVELTHGALTPPQSPPYEQQHVLTTLEPIAAQTVYVSVPVKQTIFTTPERVIPTSVAAAYTRPSISVQLEYIPPATPQPDVAHELAVVDELVRTRVEDMVQCYEPSSPCDSSSSSSNFGDCSSSDDPEWIPETVDVLPQEVPSKSSRKRSKPYSRNVEEKKSRKKEQNKNAATRYRQKKKAEIAEIMEEERHLQKQNEELENNISDIQREIKYLKGLMRDLFKAKGLIN